jgi:hypothetical protein
MRRFYININRQDAKNAKVIKSKKAIFHHKNLRVLPYHRG